MISTPGRAPLARLIAHHPRPARTFYPEAPAGTADMHPTSYLRFHGLQARRNQPVSDATVAARCGHQAAISWRARILQASDIA